jgi:Spy/CpxP family protein refolding chaperone
MKKRNAVITLLVAGVIALATVGAVSASPGDRCGGGHAGFGGPMGHGGGKQIHRLISKLDLSDEQRDQIFDIMYGQVPAARDKMKELRSGRQALRELTMKPELDEAKVRELANAQSKIIADMMVMRAETFNKVYKVLTPEQRDQATKLMEEHRHHGGGHHFGGPRFDEG